MRRVLSLGLRLEDLDRLEFGMVLDLIAEADNDNYEYSEVATQADFDGF